MSTPPLSIADFVADPEAAVQRVRGQGPVVDIEMGQMVVEYEALRDALNDGRLVPNFADFLEQLGVTSGPFYEWMARSPLNMDGDQHKRWRALMRKTFTPTSVERLRPFVQAQSERLAGELASVAPGPVDFVDVFARRLPSLGLCELVGVPPDDRDRFCAWADAIGLGFNLMMVASRIGEIDDAITQLLEFADHLLHERRARPKDDLVSRIAQAGEEEGVDTELMRGSIAGLVFAGHETTKNQLGWMMQLLSDVPEEWDRVSREPDRARAVVEEVMRLRGAATSVGRTAMEAVEIRGCPVAKGARVIGSLFSANRDPQVFPDPDRFDVDAHADHAQLSFGHGAHFCLGAALARLELREALVALTARVTCPTIDEGATWLPPIGINGPLTLPMRFEQRA